MPSRCHPALFAFLVGLLAVFALQGECQAQTPKKTAAEQKKAIQLAASAQASEALTDVYILLATASQDYKGHRLKAMTEIEGACKLLDTTLLGQMPVQQKIRALQSEHAAGTMKLLARNAGGTTAIQVLSDAQVRTAGALIQEVTAPLIANKQTRVLKHTEKATKEIETALQGGTQLAEADLLQTAYILLAAANHDYEGHRARAMTEIEQASKNLDADLLTRASVLDRIKTLQELNAAAVARIQEKNSKAVHELQVPSDIQLYQASSLIRAAVIALAENKQTKPVVHAENALTEIRTALKSR